MVFIHLGLVLADDEPEPVHGDGDHSHGGHEGRQKRNRACQSRQSNESSYLLLFAIFKYEKFQRKSIFRALHSFSVNIIRFYT